MSEPRQKSFEALFAHGLPRRLRLLPTGGVDRVRANARFLSDRVAPICTDATFCSDRTDSIR